ncbi:DUF4124 domain-containing protein [Alkalimonas collagenimarina]|uniref:DUF4124 domain-containing protein n=1 Tax=Alkalimonas collagenimarina TaxID=400390 RepID=A0ABT9GVH1_9GAMM|nr:DUF4124 domain-containing protein [Alkalimonas collagenimarina]MDP4535052.1 DUF4124 domain-containing protein [Alkalimonas collagenimarina]
MYRLLTALLILILTCPAAVVASDNKVYVYRDKNGVLVFSDSPKAGSEELKLSTRSNIMQAGESFQPRQQATTEPFTIEIVQPEHEGTVRENTGTVYVSGRIAPSFPRGFQVQLLLNGDKTGQPQTNTTFALRNLDRGEYQLQMQLIDQSGKLIAASDTITFYLHRASVINPR